MPIFLYMEQKVKITFERIYAKRKNKYYSFFKINKKYIIELPKSPRTKRFMFPYKKIGNWYICYQLTSKQKPKIFATKWNNSGINGINQWISYEPIAMKENDFIEKDKSKLIIINSEIRKIHMKNIENYSTDKYPFYKMHLRTEESLERIKLQEKNTKKRVEKDINLKIKEIEKEIEERKNKLKI